MATHLQASKPPVLANSKLGFFKTLPRELRDAVYDLLHQEVTEYVDELQFHTRTVIVKLRLISRQFRQEYDERSAKNEHNNHLTIKDNVDFKFDWVDEKPSGVPMRCPALATHSTKLTLNLIVCLGDHDHYAACDADVDWHILWIRSLLPSLPHLRAIYVRLDLVSPLCINTVTDRATLLATLSNLMDIKIAGSTSLESVGSADNSVLLATWTKQHGLQVDQEAINLYIKRETDIVTLV